jgi:hypothetical protein
MIEKNLFSKYELTFGIEDFKSFEKELINNFNFTINHSKRSLFLFGSKDDFYEKMIKSSKLWINRIASDCLNRISDTKGFLVMHGIFTLIKKRRKKVH